jgi:hypothetical protein
MKFTLPKVGDLESSRTPETSKFNCRGQNTSHWGVLYTVGKVLKRRCRKWACMSHLEFGHLQHKLWSKEGSGVKLVVWLPTIKSRESTWPRCVQMECDTPLESFRGELKLFFGPHPNPRSELGVMNSQSPESPNLDSFGTPHWESWDKRPFRCGCGGGTQRILYGRWWWPPLSPGRCESSESKVTRGLSQHQKNAKWVLTNLWLDLDAWSTTK